MPLSPEEALKRHAEGDRSPEVLAAIDAGAFAAFHAPWEGPHPEERIMEIGHQPHPWREDPRCVCPVSIERLVHWVRETRKWTCYVDGEEPKLMVRFRYSPHRDRAPELFLNIEGKSRNIVRFSLRANARVAPQDLPRALRLVNDWNQEYRWPKAFVRQDYRYDADDDLTPDEAQRLVLEGTKSSELRLDQLLYLPEGIHQAGLEAWLSELMATSWEFWTLAHQEWRL